MTSELEKIIEVEVWNASKGENIATCWQTIKEAVELEILEEKIKLSTNQ